MGRRPAGAPAIDRELLSRLWAEEKSCTEIAEALSVPGYPLTARTISVYAHRAGLPRRYQVRPGTRKARKGSLIGKVGTLMRCPQCLAQVEDLEKHVCPHPRIVEAARLAYCR